MTFAFAARVVAAICLILFVVLGFVPAAYAPTYGVAATDGVQFVTRRASPMFLAPAVILWAAASAAPGALRDAIAGGVALTFLGVAASGVIAYVSGSATWPILVAALGECAIAAALWLTRKN